MGRSRFIPRQKKKPAAPKNKADAAPGNKGDAKRRANDMPHHQGRAEAQLRQFRGLRGEVLRCSGRAGKCLAAGYLRTATLGKTLTVANGIGTVPSQYVAFDIVTWSGLTLANRADMQMRISAVGAVSGPP